MKTTVCILTVLMLCCTCCIAPAQPDIRFNRLTKEDGLSSDVIYDLLQDRNGFLWIATHGGLDRYDGYHFRHFRYNREDSNSLSGNYVHCIKEDRNGILWISTNNGLNSLDPASGIIQRFAPSPATMPKDMNDIMLVNDSILLVNAITAVYVFNKNQQSFNEIEFPVADNRMYTNHKFIANNNGTILYPVFYKESQPMDWLSINWLHNKAELPKHQQDGLNGFSESYNGYADKKGNTWLFGAASLLTQKISGKAVAYPYSDKVPFSPENIINDFFEDGNRMWFCTGGGLVCYNYTQNQFYRYKQQPGNAASLSNSRVNCMLKDRNNTYWVGTFGGGVCYFSGNTLFNNIIIGENYSDGDRRVYGLRALHSGRIIVSTMGGKKFILETDKSFHELDYAKDFKTPALLEDIAKEFTGRSINEFSSADSFLLHRHYTANCIRYPNGNKHFVTAKGLKNADQQILLPFYKKLWILYSGGILYDGKKNYVLKPTINQYELLNNNHFLFATGNGLVEFDANTDSAIRTWLPQPGNPYSIGSTWISCILPDGKGNYWIGTADAGLDFWNVETDKFYHYTTKEGLPDNKIYCILPDKKGRLWMSTDNGLSCFDTATRSFTNYTKDDGLINTEYNSGTACVDRDGWFYFGGMGGIDYFHPDSITGQRPVPVLHFASFSIYDKEQPLANSYKLATNDNNIQMAFTANDFANASKLLFRYKLAGVDEKWVSMQGNNIALYNKLPHGKYSFRVMGSYDGRSWSQPLVVDFTIATPWFKSWWFYALLVLATITGIYAFFNYRLQQQLEKQQAVENIRSKISMDIHDEIGSQLTKISLLSQRIRIAYDKQHAVDGALINKITQSSKEVVGNLGEIIWAVNPKHDNLQSLLAYLRNYIPNFFEQTNVEHSIDFPDEVPAITISPELKHNLFLVIKESLNNIIKHAAATEVKINFQLHGPTFCFEITDNGKGIAGLNGRDFGNGLINMKNRMKTVNGKFEIASEVNKGTSIRLKGTFGV